MTKTCFSPQRNVEHIRQKNLQDNQLFLEKLLMKNVQKDFLSSARSVLRKDGSDQIKKNLHRPYQRVDRATRYNEKVKSGEITPRIPEWQHLAEEKKKKVEEKKKEAEKKLLEKERRKQENERKRQEKERKKVENEWKRQEYQLKKEEFLFEKELRKIERELKAEERLRIRLAKQRPPKLSKWILFNNNNPFPYQRTFKPRHTKVGERAEQNLF